MAMMSFARSANETSQVALTPVPGEGARAGGRKAAGRGTHADDSARAQARRERRKRETGYFTSLVV